METLWYDFRYGLRMLAKNPGFTLVAVLTLALGLGANIAIFGVAEAGLLRSWPAKHPERLARIVAKTPQGQDALFSYPDYQELNEQARSFEGFVAWSRHAKSIRIGNETPFVRDDVVSPNYFSVLGVVPQIGRAFSGARETDGARPVVISDSLWHQAFHADPALVGHEVWLNGASYTVIGVAPPHFHGLEAIVPTDLWVVATTEGDVSDRNFREFEVLGRLRPGVSAQQGQVELGIIGRRLAETYPAIDKARELTLISEPERLREARIGALFLMATVGLVLLICCANVSGLILSRSEARRQEIAVRLALGAGRLRLVRQLLTESVLLCLAGGSLGLLLADWIFRLVPALMPPAPFPIGPELYLNPAVVVFAAAVSAITVFMIGLVPALQSLKPNLLPVLKGNAPTSVSRLRRFTARKALVVAEVAVAVVLLTGSGLLVRSLLASRNIELGFNREANMVFFDLVPGLAGYEGERGRRFFEQAEKSVAGLPGVRKAAFARRMPLSDSGGGATRRVSIPGVELPQGQQSVPIKFNSVSAGYFDSVGTHRLKGRAFTDADGATTARIVIVSKAMALRYWPGQDALGRHIVADGKDYEIVGIAQDVKINRIHEAPEPYLYLPSGQSTFGDGTLIVVGTGDTRALVAAVRSQLRSLDPNVPAIQIRTMDYLMRQAFWEDQTAASFVGVLGMLGMFLAAIGLYGVIAFLASQRRHEIGIRMALGAARRDVLRLVLSHGLGLAAIGVGTGMAASLAVMRLLATLLYGVKPTDPLAFASSAVLVIAVAAAASYFPARRATRVDPMVALRYE
jgi:predicted permease